MVDQTQSPDVVTALQSTTASARESVNLVNPSDPDIAVGFRPNNTNGTLLAAAGYNTTGFVPVVAGNPYSFSSKDYLAWYDTSKIFISGTTNSNAALTVTAPAGAAFARASAKTSAPDYWAGFQIEAAAAPTKFEPFGKFLLTSEVKKESLNGDTLETSSIPLRAAKYLSPSKNFYNKFAASIGSTINASTGTVTSNATYNLSDYIPVVSGQVYSGMGVNPIRAYCYFDPYKNFVSGGSNNSTSTLTVPATAAYVRIVVFAVDQDLFQFELGSTASTFAAYGYSLKDPAGAPISVVPGAKTLFTQMFADSSVIPGKTNFLLKSKNLFNKLTVTAGYQMSATGGLTASPTFNLSDYIPVTPGVQYFGANPVNSMRFHCFFTEGLLVLAGGGNSVTNTFTPPPGAAFVRITVYAADQDAFQLEVGSAATAYERCEYQLKLADGTPISVPSLGSATTWTSKIVAALGDSITAQNKWPPFVAAALGCVFVNYGIGGTRLSGAPGDVNAMCQDTRINAIPTTIDALTLLSGTNDWAQNVALGAVDSNDPLTFNGAFNTWATKAMARWPAKRMVILTTPYGELPDFATRGWPNAYTNSQGLTTRDYAQAIEVQAKRWGFPCIDINGTAGWNTLNIRTFVTDDGGLLHPNEAGGKRVAEVVSGGLKAISPL